PSRRRTASRPGPGPGRPPRSRRPPAPARSGKGRSERAATGRARARRRRSGWSARRRAGSARPARPPAPGGGRPGRARQPPAPPENLALDEALLLEAEAGRAGETLRVWEWPGPAVVLGSGCRLAEDVDEQACRRDGVPVLRRASGGGTVLLGPGCLCYSLVLAYERDPALAEIRPSSALILRRTADPPDLG